MSSCPALRADCARCAALCCLALAFDRSERFAIDKPAGEPCPHLTGCGRCSIYAARRSHGFGGCVAYDCLGAGQRVTQDLFGGRSWLEEPALAAPMMRAFVAVQRAHAQLLLLREAAKLALPPNVARRCVELRAALERASADEQAISKLEAKAGAFLRSLRPYLRRGLS
jgi:hypothetical protein